MHKEQADWRGTLNGLKDRVAGAAPLQLPIGQGESFQGVIDLIGLKAYKFEGRQGRRDGDPR